MNSNQNSRIIIAIDGYSSSGKSSMAKSLAKTIGYRYVDSGAMYRAVTLWAMRHGLVSTDGTVDVEALSRALPEITVDFAVSPDGQHTLLCGEDVETAIRSLEVSANVSEIATIPEVRHALVRLQQKFGEQRGIVMDGRDVGTTVFPDAELKIYVDASAETRAQRRYLELKAKGDTSVSYDDVLANVIHRDNIDLTRKESPLRRADDAIALDNSTMTIAEQDAWLLERFKEATEKHGCTDN